MTQIRLPFTVCLDNTLRVTPISTLFSMGDSNAHRFELTILREGVYESLSGCTVSGKFYRISENAAVDLEGTVEDGKAVVVLNKSCYDHIGRFALTITVKDGENETTVFYGDGYMHGHRTETVITGEYIIYDINMLLQKIAEIDAATRAANEAAQNANASAGNATTAADTAITASESATIAAGRANAAAADIEGMTATATTLEAGQEATANVVKINGKYVIQLGLPRGLTGATPQLTLDVATGSPGTDVTIAEQAGSTAENPRYLLTIPRGSTGDIGDLTINGIKPGADGSVMIGIDEIDGLRDALGNAGGVKTVAGVEPDETGNVPLTARALGGWQMDLLWQNASPGSGLAGDAVLTLPALTGYDAVRIEYVTNNKYEVREIGMGKQYSISYSSGYDASVQSRILTVSEGQIVSVGSWTTYGTSALTACVPTRIWGVRFGEVTSNV